MPKRRAKLGMGFRWLYYCDLGLFLNFCPLAIDLDGILQSAI